MEIEIRIGIVGVRMYLYTAGSFGTMELDDLLQVAEDVFDLGRW